MQISSREVVQMINVSLIAGMSADLHNKVSQNCKSAEYMSNSLQICIGMWVEKFHLKFSKFIKYLNQNLSEKCEIYEKHKFQLFCIFCNEFR